MIKLYFITGKELELDYDMVKLTGKLPLLGIRVWRPEPSVAFPIGWDGVMMIEDLDSKDEEEVLPATYAEAMAEITVEDVDPETHIITVEEPKVKSAQERAEEQLALMKELSECTHEEYDIYYQESTTGRARKPVKRYFPVCKKCGIREKFIKTDQIPEEVKDAAKLWDR